MTLSLLLLMAFLSSLDPCSASSQDNTGPCWKKTDGFHGRNNCKSQYWLCNNGHASEEACPEGLVFDDTIGGCVDEKACNNSDQNKSPSPVTEPTLEQSPTPPKNFDGEDRVEKGTDAKFREYPSYVELWVDSWKPFGYGDYFNCGGVALFLDWVVTAAHCIEDGFFFSTESWYYIISDIKESSGDGKKKKILKIIKHEEYGTNPSCPFCNDIALLKVSPRIDGLNLAGQSLFGSGDYKDKECFHVSLHHIKTDTGYDMGGLAKNAIKIESEKYCHIANRNGQQKEQFYNSTVMECASPFQVTTGILPGDSGSPLFCHEKNGQILVGIASYKLTTPEGEGRPDATNEFRNTSPEVYTKIFHYIEWINEMIKKTHHYRDPDLLR